jgi:hypothetical protein
MKIIEIWNEQENDTSSLGLLLRRCPASILPDVYIGMRKNENLRCIALRLKRTQNLDLSRYLNLKDIKPELMDDERDNTKVYLLILLKNTRHQDVFATLCEDLINGIAEINEEQKVIKVLLNRLEKWKSLFDKASSEGLSLEEQRGLYGELFFIRKMISSGDNCQNNIQSWIGPEGAIRDFQLADWAVEVKTTYGNNHQKIQISNERQLDTENINSLILFHLSLEVQQQNGETLNDIVDETIEFLNIDVASQTQFRSKLFQAGYFNHHRQLYENLGYQIRQENYYLVNNDFPRIEERDIRKGVGDVKYSIILSDHTDYLIPESEVLQMIN